VNNESVIKKEKERQKFLDGYLLKKMNYTFWAILCITFILVALGVAIVGVALYSAVVLGKLDIVTAALSALGIGDIFGIFKFSMDRLQRSLGDQVHVETASDAYLEQIRKIDDYSKSNANINDVDKISEEIRKAALNSMKLVQSFTEIGKPVKKAWISAFPIRYEKLTFPKEVYLGEKFSASGTLRNEGDEPIRLTSMVIAVRPPFGTPSGGPFKYDFIIAPARTLKPSESYTIGITKCIEDSARELGTKEEIPEKYLDEDWYAFMTCQTEDGYWHDDPNKIWFKVKKRAVTASGMKHSGTNSH